MRSVFLDTGYLIALEAVDDQHHTDATQHWRGTASSLDSIISTTYVFDEVVTFFNSRGHHQKAIEIGQRLLKSQVVEMIEVDKRLFDAGWERFCTRPDKRYSLTDCISFVVMENRGIDHALAFDRHFEQAGFNTLPVPKSR